MKILAEVMVWAGLIALIWTLVEGALTLRASRKVSDLDLKTDKDKNVELDKDKNVKLDKDKNVK